LQAKGKVVINSITPDEKQVNLVPKALEVAGIRIEKANGEEAVAE